MTQQFRQGDVFLSKVPAGKNIPLGKPVSPMQRGMVLAEGEVTGHAHVLPAGKVELYDLPEGFAELPEAANGRLLRVLEPVDLKHEEHDPIHLEPGDYYVGIQLEWDDLEEWRRVQD